MWRPVIKATVGVLSGLNHTLTTLQQQRPTIFPDFSGHPGLFVASDYSGQNEGARYEAYGFVMTTRQWWGSWEHARRDLRGKFLLMRRFSFKTLDDEKRWEALPEFLAAASQLEGLSFIVLVNKRISSLFSTSGRLDMRRPELARIAKYKPRTVERLLRITHFLGLLLAGLSHPDQQVIWISDQDDIAANPERLDELAVSMAEICSGLVPHTLHAVECVTTASDDGTLQLEDLSSLADFSAGALVEVMSQLDSVGQMTSMTVGVPAAPSTSRKTRRLLNWLAQTGMPHRHIVIAIDPGASAGQINFRRMVFQAISS